MLDRNELNKWCRDIVHAYIDADFDSASSVFRSVVSNCLQRMGILELSSRLHDREMLQKAIHSKLQEEFRLWVKDEGSRHELITWLEGFIIGVNSVFSAIGDTES